MVCTTLWWVQPLLSVQEWLTWDDIYFWSSLRIALHTLDLSCTLRTNTVSVIPEPILSLVHIQHQEQPLLQASSTTPGYSHTVKLFQSWSNAISPLNCLCHSLEISNISLSIVQGTRLCDHSNCSWRRTLGWSGRVSGCVLRLRLPNHKENVTIRHYQSKSDNREAWCAFQKSPNILHLRRASRYCRVPIEACQNYLRMVFGAPSVVSCRSTKFHEFPQWFNWNKSGTHGYHVRGF